MPETHANMSPDKPSQRPCTASELRAGKRNPFDVSKKLPVTPKGYRKREITLFDRSLCQFVQNRLILFVVSF